MTHGNDEHGSLFRTLLVLGRVSNLPTVWSNCLAGWLLTGEPLRGSFGLLAGGATLLYAGGMFLNDACDAKFDREHRAERPIPRGLITAKTVWILAGLQLILGAGLIAILGGLAAGLALGLVASIVAYDWLHKKWPPSLVLMALCRSLLYLVAAAAAVGSAGEAVVPSIGLGLYVLGISLVARVESKSGTAPRWPLALLLVPVPLAFWQAIDLGVAGTLIACVVFLSWLAWAVSSTWRGSAGIGALVGRLLAGIVLVDTLIVAAVGGPAWSFVVLPLLLALALILQRRVPAT